VLKNFKESLLCTYRKNFSTILAAQIIGKRSAKKWFGQWIDARQGRTKPSGVLHPARVSPLG
jgi:hypothetical protein